MVVCIHGREYPSSVLLAKEYTFSEGHGSPASTVASLDRRGYQARDSRSCGSHKCMGEQAGSCLWSILLQNISPSF